MMLHLFLFKEIIIESIFLCSKDEAIDIRKNSDLKEKKAGHYEIKKLDKKL